MNTAWFEADYLAAFPDIAEDQIAKKEYLRKDSDGGYEYGGVRIAFTCWLQQQKRHEEEVAELVAAAKYLRENHHETLSVANIMAIDAAIAKFDAPKGQS